MRIETFVEPSRKLHRRADEAIMNLARQGHRKILLEAEDENETLEASETPPAEVDDYTEKAQVVQTPTMEVQIVPGQLKEAKDTTAYPPQHSRRHAQQSVRHQMDLSENQRILGDSDRAQKE